MTAAAVKHKIVYTLEPQYVIPATRKFDYTRKRPKEKRCTLNACVRILLNVQTNDTVEWNELNKLRP